MMAMPEFTEDGNRIYLTVQDVDRDPMGTDPLHQGGALRMLVDRNEGSRANLGIVNVSGISVTAEVEIFTADGDPVPGFSPFEVELAPYSMRRSRG